MVPADVDLGDDPLVGGEAINAVLRRMATASETGTATEVDGVGGSGDRDAAPGRGLRSDPQTADT
jgi:hypothetical protein